jgi:hypothetical protein
MRFALHFILTGLFAFALMQPSVLAKVLNKSAKFKDYPVAVYKGKKASLILNKDDRMFKTRYRDLYKGQPNFAGRYAVTGVGCGGGCVFLLALDYKTGKTVHLKVPMGEDLATCSDEYRDKEGEYIGHFFYYEPDSRLMVVTGRMDGMECGARYFVEQNGVMKHLYDVPVAKAP